MSVKVFVGGQRLEGFTRLTLRRSKQATTGQLSLTIFMSYIPDAPVLEQAMRGEPIYVYMGGHLAFNGVIDRRKDQGDNSGAAKGESKTSGPALSIGPDSYTLTIECRGKTKKLVDSSHTLKTLTVNDTSAKQMFEKLVQPLGIELDWQTSEVELNRVRLRDGARVTDELERIAEMCGLYFFETRDGKLRVTDSRPAAETGEPIILGQNILSFSTRQESDQEKKKVTVKGQKNRNEDWGEQAVLDTYVEEQDDSVIEDIPISVQLYGNGDIDTLKRRVDYEVNKRAQVSKQITVEVFGVTQQDGTPWDVGDLHYVQIPPAGVFGVFEIVGLSYNVSNDRQLKTTITLAPPTTSSAGSDTKGLLDSLPTSIDDVASTAASAGRAAYGALAESWAGPRVSSVVAAVASGVAGLLADVENEDSGPPLTIRDEEDER